MGHGKHHRTDEDADQTETEQTADHARENKQQRQIGALADQDRPQKIIHGTREHRPDEKKCSPSRVTGPEQPSRRPSEHRDDADLGNRQKQHHRGKHAGETARRQSSNQGR